MARRRDDATTTGPTSVMTGWREKLVLTIAETAEVLGVSVHTVQRQIKAGQIPVVRYGRCPRVPVKALEESIARQTSGNGDELEVAS